MRKVKFLQFFQGAETNNKAFEKGQVVDLHDEMAEQVVREGRAEFVIVKAAPIPAHFIESPEPMPIRRYPEPDEIVLPKPRRKGKKR